MGLVDENQNEVVSPLRKLSGPGPVRRSSLGAAGEEDAFDEHETLTRFVAMSRSGPRRRQSYAGHRSTPLELPAVMQRSRRMSDGCLTRPQLSMASKRDRDLRKVCDDMEAGSRKAEQEISAFNRDLETLASLNQSMGKRIDRLMESAADMRNSHRHVFTGRYGTDTEHSQLYNMSQSFYQTSKKNKDRKISASSHLY